VEGLAVDTRELGGKPLVHSGGISTLPPLSELGVHPALTVRPWDSKPAKCRRFIAHTDLMLLNYGCHRNSLVNILRALNERVYYVKGPNGLVECPKGKAVSWIRMNHISKQLSGLVLDSNPGVKELTCKQFVEQCPAHKRVMYSHAADEYERRGIVRRDSKLNSFVKFEKVEFRSSGPKADPCPRIIQPRSPVFNVALGRYTRRIEESMYKAIAASWKADDDEAVVMKGMTIEEVGAQLRRKWDKYKRPVAVGLDASRFDQHVGVNALKWEHSVYNSIFKSDELRYLLKQQLRNRGSAFVDGHRVDYVVDGTRSSGDMNTSLGNCMIMSSLVLLYLKEKGINGSLANNGDDCLVFMEADDLENFSNGLNEWFLDFGFEMEVEEPCFVFEECEFCQMHPVWSDGWVMVRNPMAAISKDSMMLGFPSDQYPRWLGAVGSAGLALYGDMPIYSVMYKRFCDFGVYSNFRNQSCMETGFLRMTRRSRPPLVSDATRDSFSKAFGLSPACISALEREIATLDFKVGKGKFVASPLLFSDR
jgi:hypothetical protein